MALPVDKERPGNIIPWQQRVAGMNDGRENTGKHRASAGIIGEAQDIMARTKQMHLAGNAHDFLIHLHGKTLNWGGNEAKGRDIYSCEMYTAQWAKELATDTGNTVWTTSNIKHTIDKLQAHKIITYLPSRDNPGAGIIAWNRAIDEWVSFSHGGKRDGAGSGGLRVGSGRPRNQSSVQRMIDSDNQSSVQRLPDENQSSVQPKSIKYTTDDCLEASNSQDLPLPLRKTKERLLKNADANASGDAACADAPSPVLVSPLLIDATETTPGTANSIPPPRTSPKRRSSAAPAARASPKEKEKASPEQQQYRDACWALLRGPGKLQGINLGIQGDNTEIKAMDWFYLNKVPGQKVKEQFTIMLMDPKYKTRRISLTHLKDEYQSFKTDPDDYRQQYADRATRNERGKTNGTGRNFQQRATGISQPSDTQTKAHSSRDAASLLLDSVGDD